MSTPPEQATSQTSRRDMTMHKEKTEGVPGCDELPWIHQTNADSQCNGSRPKCQRCMRSDVPCVYEVQMENTTRYQSLQADHANLIRESRHLSHLLDALTSIPTGQRDSVLDHFKASQDPRSSLALAQAVLPRIAFDYEQVPIVPETRTSSNVRCPVSNHTCLCSDLEQLPIDVWYRLYDVYWLHYSADLPFLHRQRFLAICHEQQMNRKHAGADSGHSPSGNAPQHGHATLLLAFLALTTRHCLDLIELVVVPGRESAIGIARSPDLYALSAEHHLRESSPARSTRYDSIHARLFLTMYNLSTARCDKALLLLGEAALLVRSMNLDQDEQNSLDSSSPLSASMAYESSMMQTSTGREETHIPTPSPEMVIDVEIRTRTFWSCYILDSQLQLGKGRKRSLQDDSLALDQHATHDKHWFESQSWTQQVPVGSTGYIIRATDSPYFQNESKEQRFTDHVTTSYPITSASLWPCSRMGTLGRDESMTGRDSCQESSLSLYIKASNLLAQISSWTTSGGRRCVVALVQSDVMLTSAEQKYSSRGMLHLVGILSFGSY